MDVRTSPRSRNGSEQDLSRSALSRFAQRSKRRLSYRIADAELPASVLLLAVSVVLPLLTFVAAFRISARVTGGAIFRQKGYFLSAAIDIQPASNFGALGIYISLNSFLGVAFVRHKIVGLVLGEKRGRLHGLSLACALVCWFGGVGVAAYQHHASRAMHNAFAALFVLGALLHFCAEATIEWLEHLGSRTSRYFRAWLCGVAAVGCATFISHILVEEIRRRVASE